MARDDSPEALATALRAALEMPAAARADYSERARELARPVLGGGGAAAACEEDVLPLLLAR